MKPYADRRLVGDIEKLPFDHRMVLHRVEVAGGHWDLLPRLDCWLGQMKGLPRRNP